MTYIHHVTLGTGHSRRSLPGEAGDASIAACRASLAICLSGPRQRAALGADLPADLSGYTLTAAAEGRCLIATVWHGDDPVCTIGVARHGRCGAHLWRLLHEPQYGMPALVTDPGEQPQAPWCAARLDLGIALHMDAAHWLGDYERCLAWAWVDDA